MRATFIRRLRCRHTLRVVESRSVGVVLDAEGHPLPWPFVQLHSRCPACGHVEIGKRSLSSAPAAATDDGGWPLDCDGHRLPLSYVSLYVANGGVVIPAYEDPQDKRAFEAISRAYEGRVGVQVFVGDIVDGALGLSVITLAQPEGPPAPPLE